MVNNLLFKLKTLGSLALRSGSNHFGVRQSTSMYSTVPAHFVAVFTGKQPATNSLYFCAMLKNSGLTFQNHYYHKQTYHKGQFVYMVFVNYLGATPETKKIMFRNFPQLCNYKLNHSTNYNHPFIHKFQKVV